MRRGEPAGEPTTRTAKEAARLRERIATCERHKQEVAAKVRAILEESSREGLGERETDGAVRSYLGEKLSLIHI